jgi:hypothetical protein
MASVRINHGSVQAKEPKRAAENLAALTGGDVQPFHPLEGAWVCFLNRGENWDGQLIEFYPLSTTLSIESGRLEFRQRKSAIGHGTHFNLTVPNSRRALEQICREREITCSWRDWQGLLEVWLEEGLLIECVPND